MQIKIGNQTFNETQLKQMAEQLEKNCLRVGAHNYKKFLKNSKFNGVRLIDVVTELNKQSARQNQHPSRSLRLTQGEQFALTKEFFSNLSPELGELVAQILDRKNKNYKLKIDQNGHSHAGHSKENSYIEIVVNLKDTLDNFHQLPHELAHAVSGYNTKILQLVSNIKAAKDEQQTETAKTKFKSYTKRLGAYDKDCIGEIESHIVERLFYKFLLKKKLITKEDYQNYRIGAMNSFNSNLNQVLEEFEILSHLPCPITYEAAMRYVQNLIKEKSYNLLGRMHTMAEKFNPKLGNTPVKSEHAMRYIVAEIVATEWDEVYEHSNKNERQQMKKQFVEYLSKTADFNIEDATQFLLNKSLTKTIDDFLSALQNNANYGC